MRFLIAALCLLLAACATLETNPEARLNALAEEYVRLQLEIGTHEEGYVDAYYGPPAWREEAEARPRPRPALMAASDQLTARLEAIDLRSADPLLQRRRAFLVAHLRAGGTRLRMMSGARLAFADEAQALFGVRPTLRPLESYDAAVARMAALFPGEGAIGPRIEAFNARYVVPADRVERVHQAAIAECRRRTAAHIALPEGEAFTLELVTGQSWGAYNWYRGNFQSLIQVNTDLPIGVGGIVGTACHEGYPGHHVHNMLLEERLARARGWVEYSVYPLFSPLSFIAEGEANEGVDLAFPGGERERFEAQTLFPLAGLDPQTAPAYFAVRSAQADLRGVSLTIQSHFLDGAIDRETALSQLQHYTFRTRAEAEESLSFVAQYRSYIINYSLGEDVVRAFVERAGPDPAARWRAMERVLSEPTLPADLSAP